MTSAVFSASSRYACISPTGRGLKSKANLALVAAECRRQRPRRPRSRAAAAPWTPALPADPADCRSAPWSRSGRNHPGSSAPTRSSPARSLPDSAAHPHPPLRATDRPAAQVLLNEHAPHGRRRTERRDPAAHQLIQQRRRAEALEVIRQHRGLRIPRRKETRPGVLGPARRAQVKVHVAAPQPDPIGRGQVPDRIGSMRMRDQLRA